VTRAFILTGGVLHPFEDAAPALAGILQGAGFTPRASVDLDELLGWLREDPAALLVVYALRWSMTQHEKYAPYRARWALSLAPAARAAIAGHVRAGGGLLGVHTASICFDDWPEWREVLGGAWQWGASFHPPLGPVQAHLDRRHCLTRGLPDFSVTDEVYSGLRLAPDIEVAGWAEAAPDATPATGRQPALWTHRFGRGRAVYDSLGHDAASLEHPVHRRLLQRAALWASGRPDHDVEAA
jgi:type 1 glutamine amidotransferase